MINKQADKISFLSEEQIASLIEGARSARDRALFEALFSSGLRVAELCSLLLRPFDDAGEDTTLEMSIIGKGSYRRTVYFSPRALRAIKEWIAVRPSYMRVNIRLFPYTPRMIQKIIKLYGRELHPHLLRHSFATNLLNKGVDIRMVQQFLGHKRLDTTMRYTHVSNIQLKNIHEKIYGR